MREKKTSQEELENKVTNNEVLKEVEKDAETNFDKKLTLTSIETESNIKNLVDTTEMVVETQVKLKQVEEIKKEVKIEDKPTVVEKVTQVLEKEADIGITNKSEIKDLSENLAIKQDQDEVSSNSAKITNKQKPHEDKKTEESNKLVLKKKDKAKAEIKKETLQKDEKSGAVNQKEKSKDISKTQENDFDNKATIIDESKTLKKSSDLSKQESIETINVDNQKKQDSKIIDEVNKTPDNVKDESAEEKHKDEAMKNEEVKQEDLISKEDVNIPQAPVIIDGKTLIKVAEYAPVEINITVKANPKPKVTWTRQNKLIRDNDTFMLRESETIYTLIITKASMIHKGVYNFTATNAHGKVDFSVTLDVLGMIEINIYS